MWLTLHDGRRGWKGFDCAAANRLYQKGLICDPANKTKSVVLTDEGLQKSEEFFKEPNRSRRAASRVIQCR